jgi:hypothetical protein
MAKISSKGALDRYHSRSTSRSSISQTGQTSEDSSKMHMVEPGTVLFHRVARTFYNRNPSKSPLMMDIFARGSFRTIVNPVYIQVTEALV